MLISIRTTTGTLTLRSPFLPTDQIQLIIVGTSTVRRGSIWAGVIEEESQSVTPASIDGNVSIPDDVHHGIAQSGLPLSVRDRDMTVLDFPK